MVGPLLCNFLLALRVVKVESVISVPFVEAAMFEKFVVALGIWLGASRAAVQDSDLAKTCCNSLDSDQSHG